MRLDLAAAAEAVRSLGIDLGPSSYCTVYEEEEVKGGHFSCIAVSCQCRLLLPVGAISIFMSSSVSNAERREEGPSKPDND